MDSGCCSYKSKKTPIGEYRDTSQEDRQSGQSRPRPDLSHRDTSFFAGIVLFSCGACLGVNLLWVHFRTLGVCFFLLILGRLLPAVL